MRNIILTLIVSTDAPVELFTEKTVSLAVNDGGKVWIPMVVNAQALEEKPVLGLALVGEQKAISPSSFSNMAMNMMGKL